MAKRTLPSRLRRADSFLGIHFDFHAGKDCMEIGKTVTPHMIERIIDEVEAAAEFALGSPYPELEEALEDVFVRVR